MPVIMQMMLAAEEQEYFLWKLDEAGAADSRLQASDILSPEDRDVYQGLKKLHEMKSPRTRSFVDALSFMYTSGALLEGALLMSSDGMEDLTIKAFEVTGGPERLNAIVRDPVYQKRRKYVCRLREYIHAIVNLYGVTDLEEILNIVQDTEKSFRDHTGYTRKEGGYRNTLYYSPRYLSMGTLEKFIQSAVRDVLVTMDGLVLHGCFVESYAEEVQKLAEMLRSSEKRVTNEQLDAFFDSMADQPYRRLYETAAEKEPYIPSRKILLQYADPEFHEETEAERAFRRFVNGKYAREIAETARKRGTTAAELGASNGVLYSLRSSTNYLFDGEKSENNQGIRATEDWFESTDVTIVPTRNADGTINMHGLLVLKDNAPADSGARINTSSGAGAGKPESDGLVAGEDVQRLVRIEIQKGFTEDSIDDVVRRVSGRF